MKGIWITKHGGHDVLQVRETPDPEPAKGEVRIRAKACGLNFAEVMARKGLYPDMPPTPCIVGYEASGVVDALGEGVTEPAIGTRVFVLKRFGSHADVLCVPADQAIPIPDEMSFEEAAAIPVNYLTAYHMIHPIAALKPGESILIHMAAGGVGIAAIQICQTIPDVTIYGTASPGKHDIIREYGCHHPIDYRSKDYAKEVMRLTDGKGVHVVLDALGGKDWTKGYNILRSVGRLVAFGFANMSQGEKRSLFRVIGQFFSIPKFSPMTLMNDNRSVAGVNMGKLWHEIDVLNQEMRDIVELYNQGHVKPHIDSTYPFEQAAEAHKRLEDRKNIGKVLLIP